jgi:hypothetical protein
MSHNQPQPAPSAIPELAEALFCSDLQPSERPTPEIIAARVAQALFDHGDVAGCACEVANRYGEDQVTAAARMRWCLRLVTTASRPPRRRLTGLRREGLGTG